MSVTSLQANFQNERPIGGARIKDILYIFNGSYPVYYTGNGELYMFPEYQPSFSETVVAGPNTLMDNFEDYYFGRNFKDLPLNLSSQTNAITDFDFEPKIPYQIKPANETLPQVEIRFSYNYRPDYATVFTGFLPEGPIGSEYNYSGAADSLSQIPAGPYLDKQVYYIKDQRLFYYYDLNATGQPNDPDFKVVPLLRPQDGFGQYYQLRTKVFYRDSAPGTSSLDWILLEEGDTNSNLRSNSNSLSRFDLVNGTFRGDEGKTGSINNSNYFAVNINNLTVGLKDIRVEVSIEKASYETQYVDTFGTSFGANHNFVRTTLYKENIDFIEVDITLEKLENFPTVEEPTRGGFTLHSPWSCNNVIEHFGKLLAWGSLEEPETLFVSAVDNFAYFPYNYTIDFSSILKEPINSVVPFMNILVVQSDSYTWGLKGTSPQVYIDEAGQDLNPLAYQVFSINASIGCIAPKSVRPVRNRLYFLSQEGLMELTSLFATDDRYNVKPLDRNIINLIPQDKDATAIQFDNQYWIHFPSTKQTFRYYIDKEAWVKDSFSFNNFNGIYKYYNKNGKLHFVTHPMEITTGGLKVYEGVIDYSLATDFGQPIVSQFLTSKLNQDYPFHWKRYKELKLDFSVQNEYMPNKAPLTLDSNFSNIVGGQAQIGFSSNQLIKNHAYTVAFADFEVPETATVTVNDYLPETISIKDGMIRFTLPKTVPTEVNIEFTDDGYNTQSLLEFTVVDDTYDSGLLYDLRIMADNNTMIRDDFKSYAPITKTIDTGTQFSNITFGSTNFGDVTTFVQTTKLYGNGYDMNVYYKDDSNIKWTLETMGISYKMRRTRSDRRG